MMRECDEKNINFCRFYGDFVENWGRKNKAMLKKLTAKKSRKEKIVYDENTDEVSTKYHRNEDPWGFD